MPETGQHLAADAKARDTLRRLGQALPVRPGPLLELLSIDGHDPKQVTQVIERDPAMSARVLGVVNSAGNRRLNEITAVSRAVLQLGAGPVRTLGLAMGVQMLAEKTALPDEAVRHFWDASLRKAEAAHLAALVIDPDRKSSAYTAGLIADLGLPLLMALDPSFYVDRLPLRPNTQDWCAAEKEHFGFDHARAGAHVLRQWEVAEETCRRVEAHHRLPTEESDAGLTLALFIAGLLPHDGGEIDPSDLDRLMAVHGKVLRHAYASPDAFLGHVYVEAQRRMGRDADHDGDAELAARPFLDAIAANTVHLVAQLGRLKHEQDQNQSDLKELRYEALTDPLTKTLNRRGFFKLAEQRLRETPDGVGACCMVLDLDAFKQVNDRHGHHSGDLMLRGLAKLIRRAVARHDIIGRMGGDEFALLITDVDERAARVAAARLRDFCLDHRIRVSAEQTIPVRFSLGAVYDDSVGGAVSLERVIAAADALMYERKRSGQPGVLFSLLDQTDADASKPEAGGPAGE